MSKKSFNKVWIHFDSNEIKVQTRKPFDAHNYVSYSKDKKQATKGSGSEPTVDKSVGKLASE